MKKLIKGIIEYRRTKRESMRELFAALALGQKPDCLFIACSDSRVAVNVFASTDPGDLFVVRNLGNIMPPIPIRDPRSPPWNIPCPCWESATSSSAATRTAAPCSPSASIPPPKGRRR